MVVSTSVARSSLSEHAAMKTKPIHNLLKCDAAMIHIFTGRLSQRVQCNQIAQLWVPAIEIKAEMIA